ncbi:MAG: sugar transferase [Ardenticatenaceae bacterium]|nr:sugar transferase [Anaerolineales bacterium]MCB8923224.1 sugar transferase [Ardenticatenaceae bacterium]MCB9004831.1 sugar transferase [Ardenticatenaceae bacterium]
MNRETIRNLTIISDLFLINIAFALAYVVRYQFEWIIETTAYDPYSGYIGQQILLTALLIFTFSQNKVWRRRRGEFWLDEVARVGFATSTGIALMVAYTFFFRPLAVSRLMLIWALIFIVILIGLARLVRRSVLSLFYRRGKLVDRVLVIGSGEVGRGVMRTLMARPDLGYQAIGYLDDGSGENNIGLERIPHLGSLPDLEMILQSYAKLHTVFIALPGEMHQAVLSTLRLCHKHDVRAQVVPDVLQLSLNRVEFNNMAGVPMLGVRDVRISSFQLLLKRALDLVVVCVGGIPALLVGLMIALAIKLDSRGPVLYTAERVGRNGRLFKMYKFRSMVLDAELQKANLEHLNEADGPIFKIKDDPRLTRVGRFIRRTSLDELPQLLNVLRGQMSLVGPRPPLQEEVAQYKPWQRQRLGVIGGITGLWQVSGRSDLTFDELCLLDIYYIENWSLSLDIRILLQTIPHSLFGKGAY